MSCKTRVSENRRAVCVGDLSARVTLLPRNMTEPAFGDTDFGEDFTGGTEVWAMVKTTAGKTLFNGVNTDVNVTHEIFIRHDPTVTAETWVQLADGTLLDVLMVENLSERDDFQKLVCTERGASVLEAAQA